MAFVVLQTAPHDCREEIKEVEAEFALYYGSVVECSCGERFVKREQQFDGPYWAAMPRATKATP